MVGLGISEPSTVGQKTTQPALSLSGRSTAELRTLTFETSLQGVVWKKHQNICVKQTSGPTVTPSCTSTSFWNMSNLSDLNVYSKNFRKKVLLFNLSNFFWYPPWDLTVRPCKMWWDFSDGSLSFQGPIHHPPTFHYSFSVLPSHSSKSRKRRHASNCVELKGFWWK